MSWVSQPPRLEHEVVALALRRDFVWPDQRLNAETDSKKHHGTAQAFERDRYNDQRLVAVGWRVIRITWRQLKGDPQRMVALIASLLDR